MANRSRKIAINSLKDGVGRQAPSKRLPSEAEELVNVLVTVENSAEKRPGTACVQCETSDGSGTVTTYGDLELPVGHDLMHYWFDLTPEVAYLITIDYTDDDTLLYVHGLRHSTDGVSPPELFKVSQLSALSNASLASYIRYGNDTTTAQDALRVIALGPRLLILNTKVFTGYTSGDDGKTIGFDGLATATDDTVGSEANYLSSIHVDPQGTATIYVANKAYAGGEEVYTPGGNVFKANDSISAADNTSLAISEWDDTGRATERIPVQDFRYPTSAKAYLGQSVNDISDIKLPPSANDWQVSNNAESMLAALYPDELGDGANGRDSLTAGKGKVYYIANGYGGNDPGYYIVRSVTEKPYLMPIRTPDKYSKIDELRMPCVLSASNNGANWELSHGTYDLRTSGDKDVNPGPTVWKEGRQTPITSMALFRNRLFFAADDAVFCSELNDFGNFFLSDPALIVDTDPIDVSLSSNKYTPVSTLTPFESFMFINTTADVQFSLQGSENQITPFTAEVSSASFYSTAPLTEPILLGSQIYFFDRRRMYVFFNDRQISIQRAIEVSQHCPNYLPVSYGAKATSPAYDTIMMVDGDNEYDVYLYTNRYRGDKVVQNAFFKYTFDNKIKSFYPREDQVFMVVQDDDGTSFLQMMTVQEESPRKLYLDNVDRLVLSPTNNTFDATSNTSVLQFNGVTDHGNDRLMVDYGQPNAANAGLEGTELTIVDTSYDSGTGVLSVTVVDEWPDDTVVLLGKTYEMRIKLSPQFVRDQQNNVVDGVLSLRTMHTRHHNSGGYRVDKTIRGRTSTTVNYDPAELGDLILDVTQPVEETGETVSKIFGFSDETDIEIISDTPNPVNITQIMLKGVFRETYSSFVR